MPLHTLIDLPLLVHTVLNLSAAFVLGALVGLERQFRQRTAGLRTNVLVALGAAVFVDMAFKIAGPEGASRVVAYVVSGVGFLGAGVIMREEGNVRGLNTAATLWGSAAIGACAGAGLVIEASLATGFVLAANTLLRPMVNYINRQPASGGSTELTYTLHVISGAAHRQEALEALETALEDENLPLAALDVHAFGKEEIALEATLMVQSLDEQDKDRVVARLIGEPAVQQVFWAPSTSE